ncbi:MAG TPA: 3,4-dihydroxy-2-butanone-4-phosphate synthase [Solirubrobacterales bacterium]|nr:3,4-dihydroxy-2-butanone-4-phosphate synthase [Solirubrobacterales bacterium]
MAAPPIASVPDALAVLRAGRPLVLCEEDGGRPVVVVAAGATDAGAVNFMAREARGVVCLALTPERCDELGLELIPPRRGAAGEGQAFTVSIEAREGVTTGISAADRARTIAAAIDPAAGEADLCSPGHVFPIRVDPAGVIGRPGIAEAAVDLARAAGLAPAATLCAALGDHGDVLEPGETADWCEAHGLLAVSTAAVVEWRRGRECLVRRLSGERIWTDFGVFESIVYRSLVDGSEHRALVKGKVAGRGEVLARIHPRCTAGESFGADCGCGGLLERALAAIAAEGEGVLLHMTPPEGAPHTCDLGVAGQILADLGLSSLRLLTSAGAADGAAGLARHGLSLVDEISVEAGIDPRDESFVRV